MWLLKILKIEEKYRKKITKYSCGHKTDRVEILDIDMKWQFKLPANFKANYYIRNMENSRRLLENMNT